MGNTVEKCLAFSQRTKKCRVCAQPCDDAALRSIETFLKRTRDAASSGAEVRLPYPHGTRTHPPLPHGTRTHTPLGARREAARGGEGDGARAPLRRERQEGPHARALRDPRVDGQGGRGQGGGPLLDLSWTVPGASLQATPTRRRARWSATSSGARCSSLAPPESAAPARATRGRRRRYWRRRGGAGARVSRLPAWIGRRCCCWRRRAGRCTSIRRGRVCLLATSRWFVRVPYE